MTPSKPKRGGHMNVKRSLAALCLAVAYSLLVNTSVL